MVAVELRDAATAATTLTLYQPALSRLPSAATLTAITHFAAADAASSLLRLIRPLPH